MRIINKVTEFFECENLITALDSLAAGGVAYNALKRHLERRFMLYILVLEFSFLPQVVCAVFLFLDLSGDSALLLSDSMYFAYLAVCSMTGFFAILAKLKRFRVPKYALLFCYALLVALSVFTGFSRAFYRVFTFALFGVLLTVLGLFIQKGYFILDSLYKGENIHAK